MQHHCGLSIRQLLVTTFKNSTGATLAELMIATALIGIGVLASVQTFSKVHEGIQASKGRTLATNIGQEKMQVIMQKSYYEVLVTTDPAYRVVGSTSIPYDPSYFPPETIMEGGMLFTRYTYVQVVQENSGNIVILPPTTPDTGMRQLTVTILWSTNKGESFITMKSILNNPSTVMTRSILRGTVTNANTGEAIASALVNAAENVGWQDSTSATGSYLINLSPGTFSFMASAPGFYSATTVLTLAPYASLVQDFSLTPISSGTVKGTAWINNHLLISQVVASTGATNNLEYVELYNPTTSAITIGSNAAPHAPSVWTVVFDADGNAQDMQLVYISTFVPANGYFLITNTGDGGGSGITCDPITIAGTTVNPDACWRYVGMPNHALQCHPYGAGGCAWTQSAGGFGIGTNGGSPWSGIASVQKIDAVSWNGAGTTPAYYETSPAAASSMSGMAVGEAFVRRADTTTVISSSYGNAYDSGNNSVDFISYASPPFAPRTNTTTLAPLSGVPATGALVSISDGISVATAAISMGSPPYALFSVPGVASGTWVVLIDSGTASAEISNVSVTANNVTWIPNSATSPAWNAPGSFASILSTEGVTGMICGTVKDAAGQPIIGSLSVTAGSAVTTIGASGYYYLRVSTGVYDVISNMGLGNSMYASATQTGVAVTLGDLTSDTDFNLPKGGKVSGWMTRDGTNPLPGMTVVAKDSTGYVRDSQVSGSNGSFLLVNLTTGTYTIEPVLDLKESASPTNASVTVTAGVTTWSSTFTITGAMGTVTGSVTSGGSTIKSGVLVIVSTGAISLPPPALSSNTLNSSAFYADSSGEDGTYSVDVRGSTTTAYSVHAFYMYLNGSTPVISSRTVSGVTVNAGMTTSGVNFSW